ncbi:hypothetical protein ABZ756_02580 [Mammaliicoccus sciuri]|uniref:Uncharacterized protein n=1 Tax=Sporosarcina newyorkensis 2681 TaxID=1027292 RepID=F9DMP2_9BACL|nr:hypothetical protein [Sporosarcina newyorkensis]EGQ27913.1 hypothetical protein HMPREF9372_0072 [Sporosarcina newyorkensis 2681]
MKRFFYYFAWSIGIGLMIYLGMKWEFQLKETASMNFNILPVVLFSAIFPIVLGMLFRLPQLFIKIKENKKWTFDWTKFLAVALPALLIVVLYILSYLAIVPVVHFLLIGGQTLVTVAGIIFGYTLLDSFKK